MLFQEQPERDDATIRGSRDRRTQDTFCYKDPPGIMQEQAMATIRTMAFREIKPGVHGKIIVRLTAVSARRKMSVLPGMCHCLPPYPCHCPFRSILKNMDVGNTSAICYTAPQTDDLEDVGSLSSFVWPCMPWHVS
jgi:hypothetical protein